MKFALIAFVLLFFTEPFPQQASSYFPQQLGYKWNYNIAILDSLNNHVPELNFFRKDSSAFIDEFEGKESYHILTKTAAEEIINFLPYSDTNYVHLDGSLGYEYRQTIDFDFILSLLDSTTLNTLLPFFEVLEVFNGWYSNYRFDANLNQQYEIAEIDTTLFYDSLEVPLRFSSLGRRLQDENIQTPLGEFLCKKFVISNSINYLVIIPPLPPIVIPVFSMTDTVWIAPDNWIVKEVVPSTNIDLTLANLGEYNIPGFRREIAEEITSVLEESSEIFTYSLEQNYPNPFNPVTNIRFNTHKTGYVRIKIFDITGREVATIIDEVLNPGLFEINFNAENLSSGNYFYQFEFTELNSRMSYIETKKMTLIK